MAGGSPASVMGLSAPVDRQIGDLRLPMGEKTSLTEFLGALRGARLEVRSGTSVITGRLLSVERKTRISGGTTLEVDYIALLSENGEVRTTEVSPSFSVRLLDRGLAGKVDRLLDLVASGREPDLRRMVISTSGSGERALFVSYISEVPVWKTTYRVVLGEKTPLLQGWAIVDNTVGQDWDNVQLSLVAGAPQSFVQNLSQPYYARRPVVALPQSVNISPQTHEATLVASGARLAGRITDAAGLPIPFATVKVYDASGSVAGENFSNATGAYEFRGLPEGVLRLEVEATGFKRAVVTGMVAANARAATQDVRLEIGETAETVQVTATAPQTNTEAATAGSRAAGSGRMLGSGAGVGSSRPRQFGSGSASSSGVYRVEDARTRAEAAALAQDLGDLFEYQVKEPITIVKNRSALVPIVQSPVAAEKVSIWNDQAGVPRPQRALWITNSTRMTLDGGSFSVLEQETFAGEGVFDSIKPGEKRLTSYAVDLGLNASSKQTSSAQRVSRVRIAKGTITLENEVRETKTYTLRNEDSSPRTVIVEHPVRPGYELRSDQKPVESSAGWMRFRLQVEPKQTAFLTIEESRPLQSSLLVSNLTEDRVAAFVSSKSINTSIEEGLRRILAQKNVVAGLEAQKEAHEGEMENIFDDQQRLRENMKALKGSAEEKALVQRYTQQLNQQESRLEALRREVAQVERDREGAQRALERMIQELSFDGAL
ncbi:MAG: carboxypeptidase regulatory-like domain-containing protein [Acidobacteria bacterium]|nr:carboxypeptidase regulatory-like domain-containing protein [Acidobacteriota bacterium]